MVRPRHPLRRHERVAATRCQLTPRAHRPAGSAPQPPQGDTVAASYKPATLANGVQLLVPPFVGRGEEIIVDTTTNEFVKRA